MVDQTGKSVGGKMEASVQMETVVVMQGVLDHIIKHAQREADRGGFECVGFIAGRKNSRAITTVVELKNHSSDPDKQFMVEPWEQWKNEEGLEEAGFEIKGIYHSHPTSEARVSKTDTVGARAGELMIIYSVAFEEMEAWREKEGELVPIQFAPVEDLVEEDDHA